MEELATTEEVAAYLKVAPQTIANWASQRTGPRFVKVGGQRRYDRADVKAWVESRKRGPIAPAATPAAALKLDCDICKKPVTADGFLGVSQGEAMSVRAAHDRLREHDRITGRRDVAAWFGAPDPAVWIIMHKGCDPVAGRACYLYEIEEVTDYPGFLGFLAHMAEKPLMRDYTNLPHLIRRVTGQGAMFPRRFPADEPETSPEG